MREIGSEFWTAYKSINLGDTKNEAYLLSGRTALRFIIDDICKNRKVRKVLMPSYCCDSMIDPFIQLGIEVQLYSVYCGELDYPYDNDADIVLLIDFFGYVLDENIEIARNEKAFGKIIIYDSTHKIDGNERLEPWLDYSFCSYRKWFYCNFAKVTKHHDVFNEHSIKLFHNEYIRLRDEAAYEKKKYIAGMPSDKNVFLSKFSLAEQILEGDYAGYAGIPVEYNLDEIVAKRRLNAEYLMKELKKIPGIRLWKDESGNNDTPMFVPIFVNPLIRNNLRNYLISKQVYCPVHWPISCYHEDCNELYDEELSLICDQRYALSDMKYIIDVIKEFMHSNMR